MLDSNRRLVYDGDDILNVLKELESILISLHRIGAYYGLKDWEGTDKPEFDREINDYISKEKVTSKLAYIRRVLSGKFDDTWGSDDMDDVERACQGLIYWKAPGQYVMSEPACCST